MGVNFVSPERGFLGGDVFFGRSLQKRIQVDENGMADEGILVFAHLYDPSVGDHAMEVRSVKIKDDVFIGAKSAISNGVTIGKGAIVGVCSVVAKDGPDYSIIAGSPTKVFGEEGHLITYLQFVN